MAHYLLKRPSSYYFRYIVPAYLRHLVGCKEIRRSLGTENKVQARRMALDIVVDVQQVLNQAVTRNGCMSAEKINRAIDQAITDAKQVQYESHVSRVKPLNSKTRQDELNTYHYLLSDFREDSAHADYSQYRGQVTQILSAAGSVVDASTVEHDLACARYLEGMKVMLEEHIDRLNGKTVPATSLLSVTPVDDVSQPVALLSEVIEKYCAEKKAAKAWRARSEEKAIAALNQLVEIVGDVAIASIQGEQARRYKEVQRKLPPNVTKGKYKELTLIEAAESNEGKAISVTTFNNNLTQIIGLFNWAKQQGYCDRNYFEGLKVKESVRAKAKRAEFSDEDLLKIFTVPQYVEHKYLHPHYYWLPLIGLHTGMRIEEVCQMRFEDVTQIEGIYCFNTVWDAENPTIKNESSKRSVPVHTKLIELGFLEYLNELKVRGATQLFPELKVQGTKGFGAAPSQWFGRIRATIGMKGVSPKKDFHSFRVTLMSRMQRLGVVEGLAGAVAGHSKGESITFGLYGSGYTEQQKQEALEQVVFDEVLVGVKPYASAVITKNK